MCKPFYTRIALLGVAMYLTIELIILVATLTLLPSSDLWYPLLVWACTHRRHSHLPLASVGTCCWGAYRPGWHPVLDRQSRGGPLIARLLRFCV